MGRTLVIILAETRAHELTFEGFRKNLLDPLNADLCIAIGVKKNYDYQNPFYQTAKYRFLYEEPDDFGIAFDEATQMILTDAMAKGWNGYETFEYIQTEPERDNENPFLYVENKNHYAFNYSANHNYFHFYDYNNYNVMNHSKYYLSTQYQDPSTYLEHNNIFHECCRSDRLRKYDYRYHTSHQKLIDPDYLEKNKITQHFLPTHWREFLKIKNQFMGGIKDEYHEHPGSAAILIFFRWFLLKKLRENPDIVEQYDHFIITRSDFIYQIPHPHIDFFKTDYIWFPDGESYSGYTDRHVVLSKKFLLPYLNILEAMVIRSNQYIFDMSRYNTWNLERVIKFHLRMSGVEEFEIRLFPYIFYSVRGVNDSSRWSSGIFIQEFGCYLKYLSEYQRSSAYFQLYQEFLAKNPGANAQDFYRHYHLFQFQMI